MTTTWSTDIVLETRGSVENEETLAYVANDVGGLAILDVTPGEGIAMLGLLSMPEYAAANGVTVIGDYAYVSTPQGVFVVDLGY